MGLRLVMALLSTDATINTNLQKGSIAIVKDVEKNVNVLIRLRHPIGLKGRGFYMFFNSPESFLKILYLFHQLFKC